MAKKKAGTVGFTAPLKTSTKSSSKVLDTTVIGTAGLRSSGGRIYMEEHPMLRGLKGPALFREMAQNDSIVGAVMYLIKTRIMQVEWRFEPAKGMEHDQEAQEWTQFAESVFDDMSHTFEDFLSEVLSMVPHGWSLFEICYKRREGIQKDPTRNSRFDDGYIGIRKLSPRQQETLDRWELDTEDGIQGFWQAPPESGELRYIPIEKCVLFRTEVTANNPEGRSMLRNAVRSYRIKKRLEEIEAIGAERDLAGLPVLEVPEDLLDPQATAGQKAMYEDYKRMVQDVRRDEREGLVVPASVDQDGKQTGYKFSLLSGGGSRQMNVDAMIRRHESRMAMTLLCEFLLLGTDKIGSWSMHSDKTDVFATALRALSFNIASTLNRYVIHRLMLLNGCPVDKIPMMVPGDVGHAPLAELSSYVSAMGNAGLIQYDPRLERWVRALAGMPEPEDTGGTGMGHASVTDPKVRPKNSQQTDEEEAKGSGMADSKAPGGADSKDGGKKPVAKAKRVTKPKGRKKSAA